MQIYSLKRMTSSVDMPDDILFFTGIAFGISVVGVSFISLVIIIDIIKMAFGDRTEILLLKYYDLWKKNNIQIDK